MIKPSTLLKKKKNDFQNSPLDNTIMVLFEKKKLINGECRKYLVAFAESNAEAVQQVIVQRPQICVRRVAARSEQLKNNHAPYLASQSSIVLIQDTHLPTPERGCHYCTLESQ